MTTATMTRPRMRIVMFTESYLPRISGVAHSLHAVTRALRADGHRVLIVAPRYSGYDDADPDVVRFPSIRPPQERDFPLALPYSPVAWRRIEEADPELVHVHSPFLMGAAGARLARRRCAPTCGGSPIAARPWWCPAGWSPHASATRASRRG